MQSAIYYIYTCNKKLSLVVAAGKIASVLALAGEPATADAFLKAAIPLRIGGAVKMSGKKILMVVAPKDFRDEELLLPKKVFEEAGVSVTVASIGVSEALGVLGAKVRVDARLSDVAADEFDAVVFVGGGGSRVYFNDPTAHALAKAFIREGKVTAAICIAPTTLANAGVLSGRKATVWESSETVQALRRGGAVYTGEDVTVDGNVITANGPAAAGDFARKILEALG